MKFVSFEDTTGIYETVFFPKVYNRFCHMLNEMRPYLLKGKVEEDFTAVTLTVHSIEFLNRHNQASLSKNLRSGSPHLPKVPGADALRRIYRVPRRNRKDSQPPRPLGGRAQAPPSAKSQPLSTEPHIDYSHRGVGPYGPEADTQVLSSDNGFYVDPIYPAELLP